MAKSVIAIDVDEVLSPFVEGLVAWHNTHYGTAYSINDFFTYNFHQVWGGSLELAIDKSCRYFENRDPAVGKPLVDAKRVLKHLQQDYELLVVTSRMLTHKTLTETWINEHFPNMFKQIILCNHWAKDGGQALKKSQACLIHGAKFLIDDLPQYVEDAAAEGISGLLFGDYPWNQQVNQHDQIHRVANWQAVENYFYS